MAALSVVFVGPSLPGFAAPAGLELRAPARRGDLIAAAVDGARWIGLVDGRFRQDLAPSPTEVVEAARAGARLYGAASLGALRAVECPQTMTGVGRVFDWFRTGVLRDDDEVAGTYDPDTFRTLSHPLVRVREMLRVAEARQLLAAAESAVWLHAVRAVPFDQRSTASVRALGTVGLGAERAARCAALLEDVITDVKKSDALELIAVLLRAASPAAG